VVIATKVALEWKDGKVYRNATPARIEKEIEDSLRRLKPIISIFTRSIGRILWCQLKKPPKPWISF